MKEHKALNEMLFKNWAPQKPAQFREACSSSCLKSESNRKKVSSGVVVDDGNISDKTSASLNVGNSNYMQQVSWKGQIRVQTRK